MTGVPPGQEDARGVRRRGTAPLLALARHALRIDAGMRDVLRIHHEVANSLQGLALQLSALPQQERSELAALAQLVRRSNTLIEACRERIREALRPEGVRLAWRKPLAEAAARRGLELDVGPDAPETVLLVDGEHGLDAIVDELADNAGNAHLRIEARRMEEVEGLALCFIDDGPGITLPESELRLPFTTTRPGADGLGLFLVDCLVRASGGRLHIHPGETSGTTVRVLLRCAAQPPDALRPFDP